MVFYVPPSKRKGAFVSESALHFDGDKPNSVVRRGGRDDHLSRPTCVNRPIPPKRDRDATIPEDQRGGALPLFCLAPHGVFRASRITPRAVSSYLAFSTLPELRCQRTGGVFSVTLSVNARLRERCPRVFRGMLPYGVRTFLSELLRSDHLPSLTFYHTFARVESGNQEARMGAGADARIAQNFLDSWLPDSSRFQIGAGTVSRNQQTIASAITSLARMPARFPSTVPHPARPALTRRLPAISSPAIAPRSGPTRRPGKG